MDSKPAMEAIKTRAFEARVPIYKLCRAAKVSPVRFTEHNKGDQVTASVLGRLERCLDRIDREGVDAVVSRAD